MDEMKSNSFWSYFFHHIIPIISVIQKLKLRVTRLYTERDLMGFGSSVY